ncbi:hypothetical protein IFR05_001048 [Cadophora sp. M221]|nr:hypothetical protein IFR05_001048 [Cadophora sp. M221]
MGPISAITKTLQKAIDLVVKPDDISETRGRSPNSAGSHRFSPRRRSSIRTSAGSASESRDRSRIEESPGPVPVGGRHIHLIPDSPPGSECQVFWVPSTRRHRGRLRSLQESLNNKVDVIHPPPVPTMTPGWQDVIKAVWEDKAGGPRNKHEKEVRANFEKLKKKRWDDLTPAEKAREEKDYLANNKKLKEWSLEKDINRQRRKVEETKKQAEETARAAASASRRLERLKKRKGEASLKREKRTSEPNKADSAPGPPKIENQMISRQNEVEEETAPRSRRNKSSNPEVQKAESSNGGGSLRQAAESGRGSNAPNPSKQVREDGNNKSCPESHRSSIAPISAPPSKAESAAPQRPSQQGRSSTMPSRPGQPEAQGNSQQGPQSDIKSRAQSSAKSLNAANSTHRPSRAATVRSSAKQPLQPSQLRKVTNASEFESGSSRQPAPGHSVVAREVTKLQKESESANNTVKPTQRPQTAASSKPVGSRTQQQQSEPGKRNTVTQSQPKRTTLAPLTKENLKSTAAEYVLESGSAFEVKTVLNRGVGDNMRTVIEGLVPMSASELAEEGEKRNEGIREKLEEAEVREQDKLLVTQFQRGPGDNFRTNIEAMQPMTSEDIRVEEKKWKSYRRQQQDSEEEAEQAKLASTEFNRGVGDMMRTNIEAMIPMTSEQVRQEVREKRELEEMRLQNALLETKFNRGPGDNMRTIVEGMVSKSPGSLTAEEIRKKKQAYAEEKSQRKSASASSSRYIIES